MSSDTPLRELPARPGSPLVRALRERGRGIPLRPGVLWTLLWVAMGGVAVYFLLPQAGELRASLRSLRSVQPWWPAAGVALVVLRYALSAVTLQAAVGGPLAFRPTLLVQVSSAFVGRLTPESIGWVVLNQRYLERSGIGRVPALAAIALKVLAGALVRLLITALTAVLVGRSGLFRIGLPVAWPYLLAVALVIGLVAAVVWWAFRPAASRAVASVASGLKGLAVVVRQPARAAALFGCSAGITLSYPLVLAVSLLAFGVEIPFLEVLAVYLAGTAVAATSPTPGNLGAVEVTLSAGLVAVGAAPAPAAAAVLIYRLLTFWLPLAPGFVAFRYVQKRGHL